MHSSDFEKEIQKLDPLLTIIPNENRPGLSNIWYGGKNYDLPVVSTEDIRDEVDQSYRYEFPNGMRARFWSKEEILARVVDFLQRKKDGKIEDALYAKD